MTSVLLTFSDAVGWSWGKPATMGEAHVAKNEYVPS